MGKIFVPGTRSGDLEKARVERRLAAIFAADVAGYSRLMGADEESTHARLKAHRRELCDPAIERHRGHIANTAGDSILAEFGSVVDAVNCAAEIQRSMVGRNAEVSPDERVEFRIGINVGDIITDGDDIFGDGVNVAARLEGDSKTSHSGHLSGRPARPRRHSNSPRSRGRLFQRRALQQPIAERP